MRVSAQNRGYAARYEEARTEGKQTELKRGIALTKAKSAENRGYAARYEEARTGAARCEATRRGRQRRCVGGRVGRGGSGGAGAGGGG